MHCSQILECIGSTKYPGLVLITMMIWSYPFRRMISNILPPPVSLYVHCNDGNCHFTIADIMGCEGRDTKHMPIDIGAFKCDNINQPCSKTNLQASLKNHNENFQKKKSNRTRMVPARRGYGRSLSHTYTTTRRRLLVNHLTHWGRDKMDAVSQTTSLSAFSWLKMFEFRLKFQWSLFLRVQLTIFHHWLR